MVVDTLAIVLYEGVIIIRNRFIVDLLVRLTKLGTLLFGPYIDQFAQLNHPRRFGVISSIAVEGIYTLYLKLKQ